MMQLRPIAPVVAEDIDTLARTIYGEARGESMRGMIAVGQVARHRAAAAWEHWRAKKKPHPLFGDGSLRSACLAPAQFSCWDDINLKAMKAANLSELAFQRAMYASLAVVLGDAQDQVKGSDHYYAPKPGKDAPKWARGLKPACIIGGHHFFNNVP